MRTTFVAFGLGATAAVAVLFLMRQCALASITDDIDYRFETCVFGTPDFPSGDFANGPLLRRMPISPGVSTRFFDTDLNEVEHADKPGRYGALVRISLHTDQDGYRFITLYRTPQSVGGDLVHIPITAQVPAEFGVDSKIVAAQQPEIGTALQNMLIDYESNHSPEATAILLAWLSETGPAAPVAHLHDGPRVRNEAWWYRLQTKLGLAVTYRYLADLPAGYDADPGKRWPLVLFLHSSDRGGTNLADVRSCALAGLIDRGLKVPAVVISPQCPDGGNWNLAALNQLLDTVLAKYRVDADRVYLTGVSAGGDITWDLALVHPERFAAIVPMSGESDPGDAAQLRHVPVWGFQGERDENVSPTQMKSMIAAVRQAGGHAHLTLYPDAGHDCWNDSYANDALWPWLLAQKRGQDEVPTPGMPNP